MAAASPAPTGVETMEAPQNAPIQLGAIGCSAIDSTRSKQQWKRLLAHRQFTTSETSPEQRLLASSGLAKYLRTPCSTRVN